MRLLYALLATAVLSGTAHATTLPLGDADYRDYVRGHHALADGELGEAAAYFAGALAFAPDDPELLRQTFDLAIAAGNEALALSVAERLARQDRFESGVTLLLVADALKRKQWRDASEATARLSGTGFGVFIIPILEAWTLEARGKKKAAVDRLETGELEGFSKSYILEHKAHLLYNARRYDEAAALYDEVSAGDEGRNIRLRIAAATAWQAAKKPEEAMKRLETSTAHPDIGAAKAALTKGVPVKGIPTSAREGVAILAQRMAIDLSRERSVPLALTLARIATFLEPQDASVWLITSELLVREEQYDGALAAIKRVDTASPSAPIARSQEAAILEKLDRGDEAMSLLDAAARSPGATAEDWARYGDALQGAARFSDAAKAFAQAIAIGLADNSVTWRLRYMHGAALEQAGRWPEAETELREAMRMAPEDASLLNYLGYALLDRGLAKQEARALIERAHALAPEDGYITDSLGWAQFQAGEYKAAAETLEKAAMRVQDDPTIADHLGDAYWRVGRKIEARHRWKAALDSNPKPEQAKQIAAKYDYGLDVALADRQESAKRP
jgi:tetratricopeptide (TPR) repeat protein